MFKIRGIDHLVIRVRDMDRMTSFYCDALNCAVEKVQKEFGLIQLRAGNGLVDLVDVAGKIGRMGGAAPGAEGRNLDHLCLTIEPWDSEALTDHLRSHGAEPGEVGRRYGAEGYGPSLYLTDPEGNVVELKGPSEAGSESAAPTG